jgi:ribosome-binding factor A
MENTRLQKISRLVQKDLGEIFIREAAPLLRGAVVTVTSVKVSPDLSYAKVHVSVFPFAKNEEIMASLEENNSLIRKILGGKIRNQMRIVPELAFLLDDSFEYIEKIDNLLK